MIDRRALLLAAPAFALAGEARGQTDDWPARLVAAAESQVGRTVVYDPAYQRIPYPNGDLPLARGVCCDVVIRAYRTAFGLDLQKRVHEDMAAHFAAYPRTWGLSRPDRNIDHRRVPNLETFFRRQGAEVPLTGAWRAGDLLTQRLPGNLPHILVVTGRRTALGQPQVVHNIGAGARMEAVPIAARNVGLFRFAPARG